MREIDIVDYANEIEAGLTPEEIQAKYKYTDEEFELLLRRLGVIDDEDEWSDRDIQFLDESRTELSIVEISRYLERPHGEVRDKIVELFGVDGLPSLRSDWTDEDDEYVIENYPNTDTTDIAIVLGRSYQSVTTRAGMLGVKKNRDFRRVYR